MQQKAQILLGGEKFALVNSLVESFPVKANEKLSQRVPQIVGDFSLIPTSWYDRAQLIGSTHAGIREKGVHTKSANKGWELVAKW